MAPILIVGAGPTGLAAALFLSAEGRAVRIVDKAARPTDLSKALAVNPRTLELLEPTGVTARILDEGKPVQVMHLRKHGETLTDVRPSELHTKFPLTALPQARTEALLTQALADYGVAPEREVSLDTLRTDDAGVEAELVHADGRRETVKAPLLFAADGAHSRVREVLGIDFPGSSLPEPWKLVDVKLERPVEDLLDGYMEMRHPGFVFAMAFQPDHWRVIATHDDPMNHIPGGAPVKEVVWQSEFHIAHRIAEQLAQGRVALGGDAAHLHSPVGARGMNLGIEDAYVFSRIAIDVLDGKPERMADYNRLRHKADKGVVERVQAMTRVIRGEGVWDVVRGLAPHLVGHSDQLRQQMEKTVTGLDHEVELS